MRRGTGARPCSSASAGSTALLHLVGGWRGGQPLHEAPLADWDLLHDLLIRTVQHTSRAFHDALLGSEHGRFVLVSAKQAQAPSNSNAAYAAAKAAAEAWTLALADGFAETAATANIIVVDAILTARMREENPDGDFPLLHPRRAHRRGDRLPLLRCRRGDERPAPALCRIAAYHAAEMSSKGSKDSKPAEGEMTIRQLAERTGMTVRNIRAHQTRGLLPPPTVRGRTGYYGEEHVARIELTREMQADGLNLEAIRRVLDSGDGSASAIFDFTRALRTPFEDEAPEIVEADELAGIWGEAADPKLTRRAEKLGIFRTLPDGRVEVISPRLLRAAAELAELGIGLEGALITAEKLRRHADGVARAFVDLFVKEVWQPFDRAGRPERDWPRMSEALERMRPLAAGALLATFQIAMGEAVEKESERTLRLAARPAKRSGKRRKR